jgi:hypothetical protein
MHRQIPDSEIVSFREAGHTLPIEEPEAIAAAIEEFLSRRVPPSPPTTKAPTARRATPAKTSGTAKKAPAKKAPAKKAPATKAPATKAPAKRATGRTPPA